MEQQTLITEAANLINLASARQGEGDTEQALVHLKALRDLLNETGNLEAAEKTEAQEKTADV